MNQRVAAMMIGLVGKFLLIAGLVVLLFAGFQLWGTGLSESRAQDGLEDDFAARLARVGKQEAAALRVATTTSSSTTVAAPGKAATTTVPPSTTVPKDLVDLLYPEEGEPVARIVIPAIKVDKVVVEGIGLDDLRKGPGHFPDTPLPGQAGNASIAGHRTTYGAPFGNIDQLKPGDEIRVSTVLGESVYKVAGTRIVTPDQIEVIGDFGDHRLTLSACHPKFSAAQRIIVWAMLVGEPTPTIPRPQDRRTVELDSAQPSLPAETTPVPATPSTAPATTAPAATGPSTTAGASIDEASTTSAPSRTAEATGVPADANHLAGDRGAWPGAVGWGFATVFAVALTWVVARRLDVVLGSHAWRRRTIYVLASPAWLGLLFLCFTYVDRLLPAY